jgi:hypothetical protein
MWAHFSNLAVKPTQTWPSKPHFDQYSYSRRRSIWKKTNQNLLNYFFTPVCISQRKRRRQLALERLKVVKVCSVNVLKSLNIFAAFCEVAGWFWQYVALRTSCAIQFVSISWYIMLLFLNIINQLMNCSISC